MCVCNASLTRLCGVGDSCVPHSCITRMPPPASMSAPSASYVVKTLSVPGCFCPPVCLLVCLPIYDSFLSVDSCVCLSVCLLACLPIYDSFLSVGSCVCLSVCLLVCLLVYDSFLSVCSCVCLSVPVCLSHLVAVSPHVSPLWSVLSLSFCL